MMTRRVVIISGGSLDDELVKRTIQDDDTVIGADSGALFVFKHNLRLDVAIGDFDSVTKDQAEQIRHYAKQFISCDPVMKDMTDTEMALDYAMKLKPEEIILCGVLGTRIDHSLANIYLLKEPAAEGIACSIVDAHNRLTIVTADQAGHYFKADYTYISLLPITDKVTGVNLEGFKYPLNDATLVMGSSLGISNELSTEKGKVTVASGILLVIESKD